MRREGGKEGRRRSDGGFDAITGASLFHLQLLL